MHGEGALVAYVMGGDPNPSASLEVADAVIRGGADILEIGIPFSDPIADGRSIQAASVRALGSKASARDVLNTAGAVKKRHGVPVVLMTYFNPVYALGEGKFLDLAGKAGVDGVIVPDLPLEEALIFGRAAGKRGIDSILLASPTSGEARMKRLVANTSGFLYLVSVTGVTGARRKLASETVELVRFARRYTGGRVPLAVGFGISTPEHVRSVIEAGADAAVVGSAIVDIVERLAAGDDEALDRVEDFVRSLKSATRT